MGTARGDLIDADRTVGEARLPPDEPGPIPEGLHGKCEQPGQAGGARRGTQGRTPMAATPTQGPADTSRSVATRDHRPRKGSNP